jgi:uncharacterized protein (TIGR03790 family)
MIAAGMLWLAACSSNDDSREPLDSSADDSASDDSANEKSCTLVGGIALSSTELILPDSLTASVTDAGSGREYTVAWSVTNGALTPTKGATVSWEATDSVAVHGPESMSIRATVSADGCDTQIVDETFDADWPDNQRTVVLYNSNPGVAESRDVALYYQAFRGVPDEGLCGIDSSATSRLPAADFPAWIHAEQICLDQLHGRARYIVPVYGVPFEVEGIVKDLFYETYVTTSLDALMVFGDTAQALLDAADDFPIRNPAYLPGESDTQTYTPYTPFAELWPTIAKDLADAGVDPQYYLVARIDGSSLSAALALIDRTETAEKLAQSGALAGIVYVDGRYGDEPPETDYTGSYEAGEWNMWGTRYLFEDLDWYDVVWDGNDEEFGTAPAPTQCPDALYFAGWYSYDHYNGCFEWAPGAIGGHLDSASAGDVRGGTNWTHEALEAGITATFGAVEEPYVAGMPEYDQFFLDLTSGASFGEAAYESTLLSQWMMVWVGDPLYRPYPQ